MSLEALVIFYGLCCFGVGLAVGFILFRCINWYAVREWLEEQVMAK